MFLMVVDAVFVLLLLLIYKKAFRHKSSDKNFLFFMLSSINAEKITQTK